MQENIDRLRLAGAAVAANGWLPIVGVLAANASRMGRDLSDCSEYDDYIMQFCFRIAESCDGAFVVGDSPGAEMEIAWFRERGKPVVRDLRELETVWAWKREPWV